MKRTCRKFFLIPAIIILLLGLSVKNQSGTAFADEIGTPDSTAEIPPPPGLQAMPGDTTESKVLVGEDSDESYLSQFLNFITGQ